MKYGFFREKLMRVSPNRTTAEKKLRIVKIILLKIKIAITTIAMKFISTNEISIYFILSFFFIVHSLR